jgi:hypothetical protein
VSVEDDEVDVVYPRLVMHRSRSLQRFSVLGEPERVLRDGAGASNVVVVSDFALGGFVDRELIVCEAFSSSGLSPWDCPPLRRGCLRRRRRAPVSVLR